MVIGLFYMHSDTILFLYQAPITQVKTTLVSSSDHEILSREWRVIVHQVHINYNGRPCYYNQSGATELLIIEGFSVWLDVFEVRWALG